MREPRKKSAIKINLDCDAFREMRGCVILQSNRFVKYERCDFSFLRGKTSNYTLPCKTFVSITFRVQHVFFFRIFENGMSARSVCCCVLIVNACFLTARNKY